MEVHYVGKPHSEEKWIKSPLPLVFPSLPSPSIKHNTSIKMGVEKTTLSPGDGVTFPQKGDNVALHYTGCLYDPSKADNHFMGNK